MQITVLTVGNVKEKFYREAIKEFEKRLSRYCKLKIVEVDDEKTPDGASQKICEQIIKKEGDRPSRVYHLLTVCDLLPDS